MGPAINALQFSRTYTGAEVVLEADATSAVAAGIYKSQADDLRTMQIILSKSELYRSIEPTLWLEHTAGFGNALYDCGSRGKWDDFHALCAAFGVKYQPMELLPETIAFIDEVVAKTSDYYSAP